MPANVGISLDSPFHRFRDREDLSEIPLEGVVGLRGVLIDVTNAESRELHPELPDDDLSGAAILIRSGWDSNWGTEAYFGAAPYLAETVDHRARRSRFGPSPSSTPR